MKPFLAAQWVTRCLVLSSLLAWALWWGGLTFYSSVVVPTGARILHSHTKQGFITQEVTNWLNLIGMVTGMLLLLSFNALRRNFTQYRHHCALWSLVIFLVVQIGLLILHARMNGMLDAEALDIVDAEHFYGWHQAYLVATAAQWVAGSIHMVAVFNVFLKSALKI